MTADQAREILAYDQQFGIFFWRTGARAGRRADMKNSNGYRVVIIGGRRFPAHRLAWLHHHGREPCGVIDHWNGDRGDNRMVNLREATPAQNGRNKPLSAKANFVRPGIWTSFVVFDGRRIGLGKFTSEEAAIEAKIEAIRQHHGEFGSASRSEAPSPLAYASPCPPHGCEFMGSGI